MRVCLFPFSTHSAFREPIDYAAYLARYQVPTKNGFQPEQNRIYWRMSGHSHTGIILRSDKKSKFEADLQRYEAETSRIQAYSQWLRRDVLASTWGVSPPGLVLTWSELITEVGKIPVFRLHLDLKKYHHPLRRCNPHKQGKATKTIGVQIIVQFGTTYLLFEGTMKISFGFMSADRMMGDWKDRVEVVWDYRHDSMCEKIVSEEIIDQLKSIDPKKSDFRVAVYGVLDEIQPEGLLRDEAPVSSVETSWKILTDDLTSDLFIVTNDWKLMPCHRIHVSRKTQTKYGNAPKLKDILLNSEPNSETANILQLDLTEEDVEAFLRYQYCRTAEWILETPQTSLAVLKVAEDYEMWGMWKDIVTGLLQKDIVFFGDKIVKEVAEFLATCSKKNEKNTKKLGQKLGERAQFVADNPNYAVLRSTRLRQRPGKRPCVELEIAKNDSIQEPSNKRLRKDKVVKNCRVITGPGDIVKASGLNKIAVAPEFKLEKVEPNELQEQEKY